MTLLVVAAALVAAGLVLPGYQRGAAFVLRAADIHGWAEPIAAFGELAYRTTATTVPSRHGRLAARIYRPQGAVRRGVVLVPGVHAAGIDEPRLVAFAGYLAARGLAIATIELPDLKHYAITPRTTDMIEDAGVWMAGRPELAPEGRVGLMGISFAGSLAVVAAGRPALRDRTAFAFSFGGHGDLPRTLEYLCTGRQPDGQYRAPHDYGVAIILLGVADRVVPPGQVEALRHAINVFLEASHVDMVDKRRARAIFEEARTLAARMPEPAGTYMRYVNARDVGRLGPVVLPHVAALAGDAALSAERSPAPRAPVYLLHGSDDNVIPAVESTLLARHLAPATDVRLLLTPLITHAELDRPVDVVEIGKLIWFWTAVLDE